MKNLVIVAICVFSVSLFSCQKRDNIWNPTYVSKFINKTNDSIEIDLEHSGADILSSGDSVSFQDNEGTTQNLVRGNKFEIYTIKNSMLTYKYSDVVKEVNIITF